MRIADANAPGTAHLRGEVEWSDADHWLGSLTSGWGRAPRAAGVMGGLT
jgi:hypothetical protein